MKLSKLIVLSIFVFISACQPNAPTIVASPTAISTIQPTEAVSNTFTPEPTETLVPPTLTPTIEPPAVLSTYLENVSIDKIDNFDNLDGWGTYDSLTGKLVDGVYLINGHGDWSSGLVLNDQFGEGQGLMFEFKYDKGTEYEFILDSGEYNQDSYRRFGVYSNGYPMANLEQGRNTLGGYKKLSGNFSPQPDTWYNFMAGIGQEGDFIALIWDPTDPTKIIYYKETIGESWDNGVWQLTAKAAYKGMTVYLDNYSKLSFANIKY